MREVAITEYGQVGQLALSPDQRDALYSCGAGLSLVPEPGRDVLWTLRAGCHVGTVATPGLIVRIHPKLDIARLFVMLSAATGSIRWESPRALLSASAAIEDVIALILVDAIQHALPSGLLRGYVATEEESFVVRGRLDVTETLRRRPVTRIPLVQFPEFLDENIPENRVLATALARLVPVVSTPAVRARLVNCRCAFSDVMQIGSGAPLPRLTKNRLNARWWGAIELALLVLQAGGLDLQRGVHASRTFLVDMNAVFERFVHRALADELGAFGLDLQHNRGGLYFDQEAQHHLRPDLSVWNGRRCVFVGDCKYKFSPDGHAQRADLYQCYAYAVAADLPHSTLIYGADAPMARDVHVVDHKTVVRVRTLDLGGSSERLRDQVRTLAQEAQTSCSPVARGQLLARAAHRGAGQVRLR